MRSATRVTLSCATRGFATFLGPLLDQVDNLDAPVAVPIVLGGTWV